MCDDYAVEGARIRAVCEEGSGLSKFGDTSDSSVFLIELCLDDFVLGGSNGWQDVWLPLVVPVCADACKDDSALFQAIRTVQTYLD